MTQQTLTLYELNHLVRQTLELTLYDAYWVEAELSELRESRGHCYMDLVQRVEGMNTPVARAQARCWAGTWAVVGAKFLREAGQPMRAGLKVRLLVRAQFHEAYGFAWIVADVDPTFTLGDMARRRQEIVDQLRREGIFDLQRELVLPLFCQHVAVISSAGAAGYGDFCQQLLNNEHGYFFAPQLFPAVMQGEQVEQSIIAALNAIYDIMERAAAAGQPCPFDCVVIIRGGGATSDMSGFDTLALAENVANFPLPVITGIGHDRDECVLDMVSHLRVKTPTAAAAHLIDHLHQVALRLDDCQHRVTLSVQRRMDTERLRLQRAAERLPALCALATTRHHNMLELLGQRLAAAAAARVQTERGRTDKLSVRLPLLVAGSLTAQQHRLELMQQRVAALDPRLMLRRGYSITTLGGRALRSAAQLRAGDVLLTLLADGQVVSEVLPPAAQTTAEPLRVSSSR
ncbi:MAG: exodeoxyribonuclease VII large subunit [Prevotella sp.]|nr:exodeoxyribonuclease VII large subunit [Prevotella sp.]